MFGLYFSGADDIVTFADVMASDADRFKRFFHLMLEGGVYLAPSAFEAGFTSIAHGDKELAITLDAAERAFAKLANAPMELLQSLLLTLAAAASAILIGRARRRYGEADQPALFSAMLAFILAAASGATGLAGGLAEAQQWLERATLLLGLPLLALAALTLARRWSGAGRTGAGWCWACACSSNWHDSWAGASPMRSACCSPARCW